MYTFKTIASISASEFKDRGSRFLGFCIPVNTLDQIKIELKKLKELHPKAVHHCYAYRLGFDQNLYRANDDGEPSGSAGKPILGQIDSYGLTNILIVIVRYFGGSLLGVPGLINAYKTAAQEAIHSNIIIEKDIELNITLEFDYTMMNEVMRILKQFNCNILQQEMTLFCKLYIGIPLIKKDDVIQRLQDFRSIEIN
jgi:uncharacterized YigZ family protein